MDQSAIEQIVAERLADADAREEDARRQEVRQAASDYLKMWGHDGTLPTGVRSDSGECVFAHALGGSWDGRTWQLSEERGRILAGCWKGNPDQGFILDMPAEVREFICRFDAGEYPDLIQDDPYALEGDE